MKQFSFSLFLAIVCHNLLLSFSGVDAGATTADGLPFTIDEVDKFRANRKTFSIGQKMVPDTWGFVEQSDTPLDHKGYDEVLSKCQFTEKKMYEYGKYSTVNYYKTTADFNKFKGTDMIPENRHNYVRGSTFANSLNFMDKKSFYEEDIMMAECRIPEDDGGAWHVQRVGPFKSTGGYDWWQLGWSDAGAFSEALEKHPEGIDVISTILLPVKKDGTRIGHPPVHIHHIHFVKQNGVRFRNIMRGLCISSSGTASYTVDSLIKENNCYNSSLYFEQHGDYQCRPEDDGIECLTTNYGAHQPRRILEPLDIEGELNDVRPFDSETMEWYYQVALRWKPIDKSKKAMSQMTIMAPGRADPTQQLDRVMTFPTPTDAPRFIFYAGHFWTDGELIRNKLHAHNLVFESSSFFLATPEDLGLTQNKYKLEKTFKPKKVTDIGFENNDEAIADIFNNLEKSQKTYDLKCDEKNGNDRKHDVCKRPRPEFVCAGVYDSNEFEFEYPDKHVQKFKFDRRPYTYCKPFHFTKGDQFVVTGFSRKLMQAPAPPFPKTIPETIPGHISWHMWYKDKRTFHSSFGRLVCNQEGIFFDAANEMGFLDLGTTVGSLIYSGGIPTHGVRSGVRYTLLTIVCIIGALSVYYGVAKKKKD